MWARRLARPTVASISESMASAVAIIVVDRIISNVGGTVIAINIIIIAITINRGASPFVKAIYVVVVVVEAHI